MSSGSTTCGCMTAMELLPPPPLPPLADASCEHHRETGVQQNGETLWFREVLTPSSLTQISC